MLSFHFHYILYFVSFLILVLAVHKKESIKYKYHELKSKISLRLGNRIQLNENFAQDLEAGLSSKNFDIISQNRSDGREGLDETSKAEIKRIMEAQHISFDQARLLFTTQKFGKNNIAPDGTPMDPKAVTFKRT